MYGIYGNIYHQYTPNVSIYTIHGSYGICEPWCWYIHLHLGDRNRANVDINIPAAWSIIMGHGMSWNFRIQHGFLGNPISIFFGR